MRTPARAASRPPGPAACCHGLGSCGGPELGFAPFGFPLCGPLVPVAVGTLCQDTSATPVAVGTLCQDTGAIAQIPALTQQCAGQVVLALPPAGSQDDHSRVAGVPRNRGALQLCLHLCCRPRQRWGGEWASLGALQQVFLALCWVGGSGTTFLPGCQSEEGKGLADGTLAVQGEALVSRCRCQPEGSQGGFPRISHQGRVGGWDAVDGRPTGVPAVDGGFAAFADQRRNFRVLQADTGWHGGTVGRVCLGSSSMRAVSGLDPQAVRCGLSMVVPHSDVWELSKMQLGRWRWSQAMLWDEMHPQMRNLHPQSSGLQPPCVRAVTGVTAATHAKALNASSLSAFGRIISLPLLTHWDCRSSTSSWRAGPQSGSRER